MNELLAYSMFGKGLWNVISVFNSMSVPQITPSSIAGFAFCGSHSHVVINRLICQSKPFRSVSIFASMFAAPAQAHQQEAKHAMCRCAFGCAGWHLSGAYGKNLPSHLNREGRLLWPSCQ